jgi:biopolymer transport protein ExbB
MKSMRLGLFLAAVAVLLAISAPYLQGQTAVTPSATNAPAAAAAKSDDMTLIGMWNVGGPVMWPIGATSVAALALAVYGFLNIRDDRMLRPDLVPGLQKSLDSLNIEEALTVCNANPSFLTNVLSAGLQRISDGVVDVSSMEKAMEEASIQETTDGMKPLNNLSVSSQVAPMLGLLGTVTGMIGAFNKIGMGAMGDPEKLAGDIGEAMITTAFGLIVAIPAMFAYFYLKAKYVSNVSKAARIIGNLVHHLVVTTRRVNSGAPAGESAGGVEVKL